MLSETKYYCTEIHTEFKTCVNYILVAEEVLGDAQLGNKIASSCKSVFLHKMALCNIYSKLNFKQATIKAVLQIHETRTYTKYLKKHEFYIKSVDDYQNIYNKLSSHLIVQ